MCSADLNVMLCGWDGLIVSFGSLACLQAGENKPDAASAPLLGDLLIVGAQVLQASQFIIEEKYLAKV